MTIRIASIVSALLLMMSMLSACSNSNRPSADPNSAATTTAAMSEVTTTTALTAATTTAAITAEEAQSIALGDAGLTAGDVTRLHTELERDNGRVYYDVQFYQGTTEYDYDIDAQTGAIIEKDQDIEDW